MFIIKMMAKLVNESPEKRSKGNHSFLFRGTHPYSHDCRKLPRARIIKTMELTSGIMRSHCEYLYPDSRNLNARSQS